jgi:dihydroflavonol-4-reductase
VSETPERPGVYRVVAHLRPRFGAGPFISMSEIAKVLKERLGDKAKKVPTRKLPDWVVRLVGLFDSEVRGQVFELGKVRRLSSAKAEKDLGWSFRPCEDTLVDTATSPAWRPSAR